MTRQHISHIVSSVFFVSHFFSFLKLKFSIRCLYRIFKVHNCIVLFVYSSSSLLLLSLSTIYENAIYYFICLTELMLFNLCVRNICVYGMYTACIMHMFLECSILLLVFFCVPRYANKQVNEYNESQTKERENKKKLEEKKRWIMCARQNYIGCERV